MKRFLDLFIVCSIASLSLKAMDPPVATWEDLVDEKLSVLQDRDQNLVNNLKEELNSWNPRSSFLLEKIVQAYQDPLTMRAIGCLVLPWMLELGGNYYGYASPLSKISIQECSSMALNLLCFLSAYWERFVNIEGMVDGWERRRYSHFSGAYHGLAFCFMFQSAVGKLGSSRLPFNFGYFSQANNVFQIPVLLFDRKIDDKAWFESVLEILKSKYDFTGNIDMNSLLSSI